MGCRSWNGTRYSYSYGQLTRDQGDNNKGGGYWHQYPFTTRLENPHYESLSK